MKRFHVHAHVEDLGKSIAFYSKLFAAEPTRVESDYAKWMLDDPRINFAISTRGGKPGVDHLGIQTDDAEELAELKARAKRPTWRCSTKAKPPAATPAARSTGSPTRRASLGSTSTRWTASRFSARSRQGRRATHPPAARRAAPRGKPVGIAVKSASSCC